MVFRQALSDRERISLALSVRLLLLPAPAATLGLTVERFGPPAGEQGALLGEGHSARAERLREAVAQIRAVAGDDAALRVVCVDPDSRVLAVAESGAGRRLLPGLPPGDDGAWIWNWNQPVWPGPT